MFYYSDYLFLFHQFHLIFLYLNNKNRIMTCVYQRRKCLSVNFDITWSVFINDSLIIIRASLWLSVKSLPDSYTIMFGSKNIRSVSLLLNGALPLYLYFLLLILGKSLSMAMFPIVYKTRVAFTRFFYLIFHITWKFLKILCSSCITCNI